MAKSDGIYVVALHHFEILPHDVFRHVMPRILVMLMDVDSLQLYWLSVDEEYGIWISVWRFLGNFFYLKSPEPDIMRNEFYPPVIPFDLYQQCIKGWGFAGPGSDIFYISHETHGVVTPGKAVDGNRIPSMCHDLPLWIHKMIAYLHHPRWRGGIPQVEINLKQSVGIAVIKGGDNSEIPDACLRQRI